MDVQESFSTSKTDINFHYMMQTTLQLYVMVHYYRYMYGHQQTEPLNGVVHVWTQNEYDHHFTYHLPTIL